MDGSVAAERFPKTMWTLIARARLSTEEGRRALANVVQRYLPALHDHLRYVHRLPAQDAEDVLQSFVAERFLEKELAAHANRDRGRFRDLVLVSLNNFVISRHRHQHAQRRDAAKTVPLQTLPQLTVEDPPPERLVQISWARALISQALKLMQDECNAGARQDILAIFEARVLSVSLGQKPLSYQELAEKYKLSSPTQAANLLVTGKRMFARALRATIADYEPDEERIDEEIRDLQDILSQA